MGKEKSPPLSSTPPTFSAAVDALILEKKLPRAFPPDVEEEAAHLDGGLQSTEVRGRLDLRQEVTVTIDGETARDFDDAVSVAPLPGDGTRLRVSIADVSFYVHPGSLLDREAFRRGTSTYFPDRVIPMLPERLSNDLCSLVPYKDRPTFTATMEFDAEGHRRSATFERSLIRSAARLTYTTVRKILVDREPQACRAHESLIPHLERMERLMDRLQERRRERGSLDFDLPEPEIVLDIEEGGIDRIVRAERNKAHRMIEEFMIAANEAVAEFVLGLKRPMIYRVHGNPDAEKLQEFALVLHNLGVPVRLGKKPEPRALVRVIEAVRGQSYERLVNTLMLRSLGRAVYATNNIGHFGLASRGYTHFTSPIRRYPDLIVHRILARALEQQPSYALPQLQKITTQSTELERGAMETEWAVRDLAAAWFMKDRVGEHFEATVSQVTRFGFFVELHDFFVEGLVSMRSLKDDFYIFHEKSHQLVGRKTKKRFRIGDRVRVVVKGANVTKRWVDLEVEKTNNCK